VKTIHLSLVRADNDDGRGFYNLLGGLIVALCPLPPKIGSLDKTQNPFVLDRMMAVFPTLYPSLESLF
jgi:hypothetical protein